MAASDMTKGSIMGHLVRYSIPLILGNLFQLAYNAVDSMIAGRFIGKEALAALGTAGRRQIHQPHIQQEAVVILHVRQKLLFRPFRLKDYT